MEAHQFQRDPKQKGPVMPVFPDDIFTEPTNVDPDTLANLGPLRRLAPVLESSLDVFLQLVRQFVGHRIEFGPQHRAAFFLNRGVELVGGVCELPHAIFDEL